MARPIYPLVITTRALLAGVHRPFSSVPALKLSDKPAINTILEIKGQFTVKSNHPFGKNPLTAAQIIDQQIFPPG
jgi:hypothetical protein